MYFCGRKSLKVQEGQEPQPWRSNAVVDDADKENFNLFCVLKNIVKNIDVNVFSKTLPKHRIVKEKA